MPASRKPRDPALLDALDAFDRTHFAGETWRVVRKCRDPLQGSASGGRWDPALFDVLYTSLESDGALAEVRYQSGTSAGISVEDPVWTSSNQTPD
jgi:RES domain-containing protein